MQSYSTLKKFYNNTVTIYRKVSERDNHGGVKNIWKKVSWSVPGRVFTLDAGVYNITFEGVQYSITRKFMCDKSVDIREGDKIIDSNYNNTYLVVRVHQIQNMKSVSHFESMLAKMEGE